jgi:hypothetical protein
MYTPTALGHVSKLFEEDDSLDVVCSRVLVINDYSRKTSAERVAQTDLVLRTYSLNRL